MRITPALSFTAHSGGQKDIEADIAAFWQETIFGEKKEGLLFAECKTYGTFKEVDYERMRHLAKTFPGSVLVFSTLRKTLTKRETTQITRIAKRGRKYWKAERPINPVLILTGTELLGHTAPPYCWSEGIREKMRYYTGFLGLCNATQMIHLDLPPWETEWHNTWEKRRQKRRRRDGNQAHLVSEPLPTN